MSTYWKARIAKDDYSIQFDTDKKDLYKLVEKACQKAQDKADKDRKERKIGFQYMILLGNVCVCV